MRRLTWPGPTRKHVSSPQGVVLQQSGCAFCRNTLGRSGKSASWKLRSIDIRCGYGDRSRITGGCVADCEGDILEVSPVSSSHRVYVERNPYLHSRRMAKRWVLRTAYVYLVMVHDQVYLISSSYTFEGVRDTTP
jgi:hypothetical protein